MSFRKAELSELGFDPFAKIGKEWMLLTGGSSTEAGKWNTMTASWGQAGVLWNKNVVTCYVRPNRHTFGFIEAGECFTASFFTEEYRPALSFCGSHSGRDCDKAKETGLTPVETDGCVTFEEADTVLVLRKLYAYDLTEEGFLTDDGIPEKFFGEGNPYHRAYICEIVAAYRKD